MICSDGLTDMIDDAEIVRILEERDSLDAAARALVSRANDAGGQDNITVIAFEITDEPDEPDEHTVEHTLTGTQPRPSAETAPANDTARQRAPAPRPEPRGAGRRFLPLLLLIAAIVVAAVVLWVLAR
jgi:protein phosphatase